MTDPIYPKIDRSSSDDPFLHLYPDIIAQFMKAKDVLEANNCKVISTTAWSLIGRLVDTPVDEQSAYEAGCTIKYEMFNEGFPLCNLHHSNCDANIYVSVQYNLSMQ